MTAAEVLAAQVLCHNPQPIGNSLFPCVSIFSMSSANRACRHPCRALRASNRQNLPPRTAHRLPSSAVFLSTPIAPMHAAIPSLRAVGYPVRLLQELFCPMRGAAALARGYGGTSGLHEPCAAAQGWCDVRNFKYQACHGCAEPYCHPCDIHASSKGIPGGFLPCSEKTARYFLHNFA